MPVWFRSISHHQLAIKPPGNNTHKLCKFLSYCGCQIAILRHYVSQLTYLLTPIPQKCTGLEEEICEQEADET